MKIKFRVDGKPPKKNGWKDKNGLIKKIRERALAARRKVDMRRGNKSKLKINLTIYTRNISTRIFSKSNKSKRYSGDLDGFISGIFDYLGPAVGNVSKKNVHDDLKKKNEINFTRPLIIDDDSQIVECNAKKVPSDEEYYTVEIIFLDENLKELD